MADQPIAVFADITESWQKDLLIERLSETFELVIEDKPLSEFSSEQYQNAQILSIFINSDCKAKELERWPELEFIATRSTGYDHIDLSYCSEHGITVSNVPTYGDNTVAEHTFALILSLSRNLYEAVQRTQRGDYELGGIRGFDLRGKTIGIIGTGHIGIHVAKMARGFGMNILAYDIQRNDFLSELIGFDYVDLETLVEQSHIISLHCPLTESTRYIIDEDMLSRSRDDLLVINTARGELIDTDALLRALEDGRLGGAGLDVIEGEEMILSESKLNEKNFSREKLQTLVQNNRLLKRDNVIFTPHMAYNSREAIERIFETTIDNIKAFQKENPIHTVN